MSDKESRNQLRLSPEIKYTRFGRKSQQPFQKSTEYVYLFFWNGLNRMLTIRQAHMDFEDAVADFPVERFNTHPPNCDYTFWHLLEHIRICRKDILEYIASDNYQWPDFPNDLWPDKSTETDAVGWQKTIEQFLADRQKLVAIINDEGIDLFAPLSNSREHQHNILREINIIANHNAYHTGELGVLRQVTGLWV